MQLNNKPSIILYACVHDGYERKVREIQAGMEEEGIPCVLFTADDQDALLLARKGAMESLLGVGVGVGLQAICIHHQKLPAGEPLFRLNGSGTRQQWRRFGYNAARLIKGIPFKAEQADDADGADITGLYEYIRKVVLKVLQETGQTMGR